MPLDLRIEDTSCSFKKASFRRIFVVPGAKASSSCEAHSLFISNDRPFDSGFEVDPILIVTLDRTGAAPVVATTTS